MRAGTDSVCFQTGTYRNQVGDIKKDDLPGPEALEQPGRKDQDVKMVRVGNIVEAHMVS